LFAAEALSSGELLPRDRGGLPVTLRRSSLTFTIFELFLPDLCALLTAEANSSGELLQHCRGEPASPI
jgi:hypothetical protein